MSLKSLYLRHLSIYVEQKKEIDSSIEQTIFEARVPICFDGSPLATGISIVQHLKGKLLLYTVVFGSKTFCFLASMDHLISVTSLQVETMARVARAMCLFVNWSVLSNDPPFQLVFQSFEVAVKGKEEGNHKCNETKEVNVVQLIWSERKLSGRLPEIKHGFGGQIRSSWKQIKWNNLKAELNSTRWWDALVVPFYVTFSCSVVISFFSIENRHLSDYGLLDK